VVKTGAEGVYGGVSLSGKIGFALKIDDGATRAADVALGALLNVLDLLDSQNNPATDQFFQPPVLNSQGVVVGRIAASGAWPQGC